jgi:hypothetical protein
MGLIGSVSPRSLALGCCKRMAVPHSVDLEIDIGEVVASSLRSWAKNPDQVYGAPRLAPWTGGGGGGGVQVGKVVVVHVPSLSARSFSHLVAEFWSCLGNLVLEYRLPRSSSTK